MYGTALHPAKVRLLASQTADAPLVLDSSWLAVGHVDEFMAIVPADNERGWIVLVADPRAALDVLGEAQRRGAGSALLLDGVTDIDRAAMREILVTGQTDYPRRSLARTVDAVLADPEVLAANDVAIAAIDANLETLVSELGLDDDEIVRVPVLFDKDRFFEGVSSTVVDEPDSSGPSSGDEGEAGSDDLVTALLPNAVNGLYVGVDTDGSRRWLSPSQRGPVVDGRDLMEDAVTEALTAAGLTTGYIDVAEYAHIGQGALHCVTNALRVLPA